MKVMRGWAKGRVRTLLSLVGLVLLGAASSPNRLTPVETKLPAPPMPPQPHSCVISSPYSTQTKWPACQ